MKLNYKRTICVGFAFFLICAFWQAYDNTVPLILTNKFGMSQAWSGVIMALDNILALFLLPLFGAISDKHSGKRGRRTPFILIGTIVAAIAFISLSLVDDAQLKNLDGAAAIDDPAALRIVYQKEADRTLKTPDGETFVLSDTFTEDEFAAITSQVTNAEGKTVTNHDYTNYVVPARQAYAHQTTLQHPGALIGFIALLLVVLVAMATFRSPAVALMPDVTIKPLRSKANAVINLMGTGGGILVLAIGMGFATSSVRNSLMSYTAYFSVIAGLMVLALLIFRLTVNEPKFVAEMQADSKRFGIDNGDDGDTPAASGKLGKAERRSLIFLLLSIVLWFFGYNAVTSKYSVYASNILHKDYNLTLMLAQAAAIVAYLPVGIVASKIGRKKNHSRRRRDAGHRVRRGCVPQFREPHDAHERDVLPRRYRLGDHQRQLLPDGRRDVLRQRRRPLHRFLLHGQHGRAGHHADVLRLPDGQGRHDRALPVCRPFRGRRVCDHALRPPWRQPSHCRHGPGSARHGRLIKNSNWRLLLWNV